MVTPRYGMKFSTIRYFQKQAFDLHLHNGIHAGVMRLVNMTQADSAREIGLNAIQAAYVLPAGQLRAVLRGER